MKRLIVVVSLAAVCAAGAVRAQQSSSAAAPHATGHAVITPDAVQWQPGPPALPPGAQASVLDGDPAKAGEPFTIRLKFPDGYSVPPHWHPVDETVTVLQGTFMLGLGEKADVAAMKTMTAGSFGKMPKEVRHYARAKGDTLIQVNAIGPFVVNYVNPSDDPRKKSGSN
jgi:quercetin dioxygenase-like cupin family protein